MDDWIAQARSAAGPCPACRALAARPIVYGTRLWEDDEKRLDGRVVFGGCCEDPGGAVYSCGVCGQEWR